MRIAIVGAGISGLGCALALNDAHQLSVFEAGSYLGGHANTVDVTLEGKCFGVDTGFLVYNERTYPNLIRLFADLHVAVAPSEMSFSVSRRDKDREWCGSSLRSLFAQPSNALSPSFWSMLKDIQRFNKQASQLASSVKAFHAGTTATADTDPTSDAWNEPLEQFLDRNCYGIPFRRDYLLPMAAAIWSCPKSTMAQFPIGSFVRFFNNHGLLQITDRPQWFTVAGGSKHYVAAIEKALLSKHQTIYRNSPVMRVDRHPSGVTLHSAQGAQEFDAVVMACHSDQALKLLKEPSPIEQEQLGAIKYQVNRAYLHTDAKLMPRRKQAWAAWNYLSDSKTADESQVCVTYWLNRLQPLPCGTDLFVSLNPLTEPEPGKTLSRIEYAHPIFDRQAMQAQRQFGALQGQKHTWYAGAWLGYGFHEDGLSSGLAAARRIEDHLATQSHNPPASLAA